MKFKEWLVNELFDKHTADQAEWFFQYESGTQWQPWTGEFDKDQVVPGAFKVMARFPVEKRIYEVHFSLKPMNTWAVDFYLMQDEHGKKYTNQTGTGFSGFVGGSNFEQTSSVIGTVKVLAQEFSQVFKPSKLFFWGFGGKRAKSYDMLAKRSEREGSMKLTDRMVTPNAGSWTVEPQYHANAS
jgi:hypothetical protein